MPCSKSFLGARSSRLPFAPFALAVAVAAGCAADGVPPPVEEEAPQVLLQLAEVPQDAACLRLTATGRARTVVRYIPLSPGEALTRTLSGLPLGAVVFWGEAFTKGCEDVTTTTIPAWVAEPVDASISVGHLTSIALLLERNGRAKVDVAFSSEALCSPAGEICKADRDCCGRDCQKGRCVARADGGAADDAAP